MKNKIIALLLLACVSFTACSEKDASSAAETSALESVSSQETAEEAGTEAPQHETSPEQEIGFPGMTPIYPDGIKDGEYDIQVDSSSSMFRITACKLTVSDGEMTAVMTSTISIRTTPGIPLSAKAARYNISCSSLVLYLTAVQAAFIQFRYPDGGA